MNDWVKDKWWHTRKVKSFECVKCHKMKEYMSFASDICDDCYFYETRIMPFENKKVRFWKSLFKI